MKNEEAQPAGRTGRPAGPVVLATRPVNCSYGAGTYRTGTAILRLALHVTALLDVTAKGATAKANRAEAPCVPHLARVLKAKCMARWAIVAADVGGWGVFTGRRRLKT